LSAIFLGIRKLASLSIDLFNFLDASEVYLLPTFLSFFIFIFVSAICCGKRDALASARNK
jgi:hypothetical protein